MEPYWIEQPFLMRVCDDVCLFTLNFDDWSAWETRWLDNATVTLVMRKYPGLIDCTVELNVTTNEGWAANHRASVAGSFLAVKDWIRSLT